MPGPVEYPQRACAHFTPDCINQQANFDTKLIVMNTCNPADGVLTCNDDGPSSCSGWTSITPPVVLNQGITYIVAIGG